MWHTRRIQRAGYTLIDLVIVLMLVGFLAAASVPRISTSLHRHRADAAANRIKADVALVRQRALSHSTAQTMEFSLSDNNYSVSNMRDIDLSSRSYRIDLHAYPYKVDIELADLGGASEVMFDRFGRPDTGGTITVRSGNYQQTVTIDAETGRATIP